MSTKQERGFGAIVMGLLGFAMGSFMIVVGIALSLTFFGAVLGVPLIFLGIGMMGAGLIVGATSTHAKCPVCETPLWFIGKNVGITCRRCKHRIILQDGQPVSV